MVELIWADNDECLEKWIGDDDEDEDDEEAEVLIILESLFKLEFDAIFRGGIGNCWWLFEMEWAALLVKSCCLRHCHMLAIYLIRFKATKA